MQKLELRDREGRTIVTVKVDEGLVVVETYKYWLNGHAYDAATHSIYFEHLEKFAIELINATGHKLDKAITS